MYMSASAYMGISVSFWLYPKFELQRAYMAYPAMTAVYVSAVNGLVSNALCSKFSSLPQYMGFLLGIIYGIDAYSAYKFYKGYR